MEDKLDKIYNFLNRNRLYNKQLQTRYYQSLLDDRKDAKDNVIALLYNTYNTQSQPKMDKLATFMKDIAEKSPACLETFNGFIKVINPGADANYKNLYEGLRAGKKKGWGWGPKTAALFSKVIYHLHMKETPYGAELIVWKDAPNCINADDRLWLPVDRVINEIFNKIRNENVKNVSEARFNEINDILQEKYKGDKIEVWDDLWFWGFITQKICEVNSNDKIMTEEEIKKRKKEKKEKKTIRDLQWNDNKYWSQRDTSKDSDKIKDIKREAKIFIEILKSK